MTDVPNQEPPLRITTLEKDISITERTREFTRVAIAFFATSSFFMITLLSFAMLWKMGGKFEDLKEILHILIPPTIGIFGAVVGFYFGEKSVF